MLQLPLEYVPLFPTYDLLSVSVCLYTIEKSEFVRVGGDGPKLIDLLQMREKYLLQDRIELLGAVRHTDVLSVGTKSESIYLY